MVGKFLKPIFISQNKINRIIKELNKRVNQTWRVKQLEES